MNFPIIQNQKNNNFIDFNNQKDYLANESDSKIIDNITTFSGINHTPYPYSNVNLFGFSNEKEYNEGEKIFLNKINKLSEVLKKIHFLIEGT